MLSTKEIFQSRGYNVPTYVIDADGKRVEIEISENEEQSFMYDKIIMLLVGAGYYRARIKGLNPFDVVVGGMTWCLDSSSSIDLDVDFLFKEDLNTGQKIALTEKIVVVLPKIKCPYFIEPHQIQGLDFIHICPVIDWLIKWSAENRQKKARYLETYAINQYYKKFDDPKGVEARELEAERRKSIKHFLERYQPRHTYKQSDPSLVDLELRIESTLAEYGLSDVHEGSGYALRPNFQTKFARDALESLTSGLKSDGYSEDTLNFENADRLLGADFQVASTERKITNLRTQLKELKNEKDRLTEAVNVAADEAADLTAKNEQKEVELESLAEEERNIVKQIQSMIQTHEKLKEEEKSFKERCKVELNELETEIAALEDNVIEEEIEELRVQMEHLQAQLYNKKRDLGKIMRSITKKERVVDQIPSRAELSQYQKRFLELYNQLALKHTETKRYFILFNTLNDKYKYMQKEYTLLNSIHDSYIQVMTASGSKDEFMRQLHGIVAGILQTKEKVAGKRNETRRMKERLADHLAYLQRVKSEYINGVKELSETYKKNEALEQQLQRAMEEAGYLPEK